MTDVLFTHSYVLRFDPKEHRAMMPYPPIGSLYAAAVVRQAGFSVALFDAMLISAVTDITTYLVHHRPRFLVIYDDDFNYLTKMCLTRMRHVALEMAALAHEHGCSVIVHGSDATDHQQEYFNGGADYIVVGEGEITLRELLEALSHNASVEELRNIPGIAMRLENGTIVRGPRREVIHNLDTLPMPARDLVDIDAYRSLWMRHHGYFSLNIATTRGCPFRCNWCAKPLYGQVYNVHSPERIAQEIAEVRRLYNPDHIWMCDDIFGLKPGWIAAFAAEVKRLDAVIPFKCLSRADLVVREGVSQALLAAGCRTVWIGAESGAQAVLDAMDKGITVEQIHRAVAKLRALGIRVGFFLQLGYPGEGEEEITATVQMVRRTLPDEIGISVAYPLPGTRFYEQVEKQMGDKRNWSESADLAMMFKGTYSTEFYRICQRYIHMDHRYHQGRQLIGKLLSHSPLTRDEWRRVLLIPYYYLRRIMLAAMARRTRSRSAPEPVGVPVAQS